MEHPQVDEHTHSTQKEREKEETRIFEEIMSESFPTLMQYMNVQIQ